MKSFGVDAEWIPGEERRHRLKMTAMKPSGNHPSAASVAGRRRRSAESARAACPRRWVGSRGGCALLSLHTGSRYLAMPSRPCRWHCETSGTRAPRMLHWYRMTGVRLVRDTSVDHSGTLAGRIGCLCAAHGIQALLSHRHRRACPRHSPCCHGRSERIICTGCRRRPVFAVARGGCARALTGVVCCCCALLRRAGFRNVADEQQRRQWGRDLPIILPVGAQRVYRLNPFQ